MSLISKIYRSPQYMHEAYEGWTKASKPERRAPRKPIMIWARQRFEVHHSYEIRNKLKGAGFQFDPQHKCWFTGSAKKAVRAIKLADAECKQMLLYLMTN